MPSLATSEIVCREDLAKFQLNLNRFSVYFRAIQKDFCNLSQFNNPGLNPENLGNILKLSFVF